MNKFSIALIVLFCYCISCVKINPIEIENGNIIIGESNVLICNEGGFQNGNASLSIYNKEENTISNDLYQSVNNSNIGDILQSITHINHELYLVVNNSQKIIVIDDKNYSYKTEINSLTSPRYILPINANQAYVSDLYANKIYIIDINTKSIVNEINVSGWCEDMYLHNGKAYVVNRTNDLVYIINTSTNLILDSIYVNNNPSDIEIDKYNNIWVLSKGDIGNNISPSISIINTIQDSIIDTITLNSSKGTPSNLRMNSDKTFAFYIQQDVIKTETNYPFLSEIFYVNTGQQFYGLGLDPYNQDVYISDAIDYVQNGLIYRLDSLGNEIDLFNTGIIPNQFLFD